MKLKCIGVALVAAIGLAQSTLKFDVTSVRLNTSPDSTKAGLQLLPGGRFIATDIPLRTIIAAAWNLPLESPRLTLAPGVTLPDEIYDIEATAPEGAFPRGITTEDRLARMRSMLQALLEDRFRLSVRVESREEPVYALVVGKGGPKLEKSKFQEQNCGDTSANWISNPACHFLFGSQNGGIHSGSVTIAQVVQYANNFTDRPLFDKTGLAGFYDVQTDGWAPMRVGLTDLNGTPQGADANVNNSERPTLFDVFEKLGLRMESQKAVVDMFVIEHVERPGAN